MSQRLRVLHVFSSFALCAALMAQQVQSTPKTESQSAPIEQQSLVSDEGTTSLTQNFSAKEILRLIDSKPELMVDLKDVAAESFEQQGFTIQADAISDKMLLQQIHTNRELQRGISEWLVQRGYKPSPLMAGGNDATLRDGSLQDDQTDEVGALARDEDRGEADSMQATAAARLNGRTILRRPQTADARERTPSLRKRDAEDKQNDLLRVKTPYNLQALRDLYTQQPQDAAKLKRFGSDVFLPKRDDVGAGTSRASQRDAMIDLPAGPDYILGPGDTLQVTLSGGVSQSITRIVDREGKVLLPEAGGVLVGGLTMERAQSVVEAALRPQFRNVRVEMSLAKLRTIRVYVVGDVQRPGAYEVSSLSSPINALFAAGGPTSVGSLRTMRQMRGPQVISEIDLYDFLLHGVRDSDTKLQSGDTLLVPPAGPQITIAGAVRRPAIYELRSTINLPQALELAGGATVEASLTRLTVDRIEANTQRKTVTLDLAPSPTSDALHAAMTSFQVQDGDRIHIASILPFSEAVVYVEGHVARPGRIAYHDGMELREVLRSYRDLLPEPAPSGEIIRLVPPDLHPEAVQFSLDDVMIGNSSIRLQPFDTVRVRGRYQADAPQVTVRGEVLRPGIYALPQGMTASQLVKIAGGFKRDALLQSADLTSYTVQNGESVVSQRTALPIGAAMYGEKAFDQVLKPGDVLTIHQISGWSDIGASVSLLGEVEHPGSYGLQAGERLSSVLQRAGGYRDTAYPDGAVLVRKQVRELEQKNREELIRQIESTSAAAHLRSNLTNQDETSMIQAAAQQQNEVLARLRSQPPTGRMVIHISSDINSWAGTPADIELRSDDILTIPKRPGFVLVSGQVYNASAETYQPDKSAGWYLQQAGGTNDVANRKEIFIIRANGSVVGRRSASWHSSVLDTKLNPGDAIVVPQRVIGGSLFWKNLLTIAQLSSSVAITAAVAGVF